MKRQNKYKIDLRSQPGIHFTTSFAPARRGSESGPWGRYCAGLLLFLLLTPGLFLAAQWLQIKSGAANSLLLVPNDLFLYGTAFMIALVTGAAALSIMKRRNYLNPLLIIIMLLLLLLSQTFYIRVTPGGIRCHELLWEKSYPWAALRAAAIRVESFGGFIHLDYRIAAKDGRKIVLNPLIAYFPNTRDLMAVDRLLTSHRVPVAVKPVHRQLPVKVGADLKSLIGRHAPEIQ